MRQRSASLRRFLVLPLVLLSILVGVALGLYLGWQVYPVSWYDTDPSDLRVAHQQQYLRMAADSLAVNGDVDLARLRLFDLTDADTSWQQVADLITELALSDMAVGDVESAARLSQLAEEVGLPEPSGAPVELHPTSLLPVELPFDVPNAVLIAAVLAVLVVLLAIIIWLMALVMGALRSTRRPPRAAAAAPASQPAPATSAAAPARVPAPSTEAPARPANQARERPLSQPPVSAPAVPPVAAPTGALKHPAEATPAPQAPVPAPTPAPEPVVEEPQPESVSPPEPFVAEELPVAQVDMTPEAGIDEQIEKLVEMAPAPPVSSSLTPSAMSKLEDSDDDVVVDEPEIASRTEAYDEIADLLNQSTVKVADERAPAEEPATVVQGAEEESIEEMLSAFEPEDEPQVEEPQAAELAEPVVQAPDSGVLGIFSGEYSIGDDDFDRSYGIETADGDFLGECGLGVSDVYRIEGCQQVDAFEVWLFDKSDIRTVSKVLVSRGAMSDPAIKGRLSAKGDLVEAANGLVIELETLTLRLRATLREYAYETSTPFAQGIFASLIVDMQVTKIR